MKPPGRVLGVDYGERRVGLAVSDTERRVAVPLAIYERRDGPRDGAYFRQVVTEHEITGIVVGLPVHMSGDEGDAARSARAFGTWLRRATKVPVVYWDERLSTAQAQSVMRVAGLKYKQRRDRVDKVAAQIFLQSYLDTGCPADTAPGPLAGEPPADADSSRPNRTPEE
jgi:putative Holliday junction resolvase